MSTQHDRWLELHQNNNNKDGFDGRIYKSKIIEKLYLEYKMWSFCDTVFWICYTYWIYYTGICVVMLTVIVKSNFL